MTTEKWSDWSCAVAVTAVSDHDLEPAVAIVRSVMAEVEIAASRFRDDSDLSRINAQAGRYVTVRPMTVELVELALDAARRTGGKVTPTVGAALLAQGYDDDIDVVRARSAAPAEPAPVPAADDAV
ncbi:MAG: FAD:protein FMN transferase, partial [Nocardioidaceae bacterium]|nr:FAD:protein FMN transferase [Nocardioidaceae bacterium]